MTWPFADPKNVAVYTVKSVWQKKKPILYVYHDADDGAWQFHADEKPNDSEASIVALEEIVKLDQSVTELADLPFGWCAYRKNNKSPWIRCKTE